MSDPRQLRRQLNTWTFIALGVLVFGLGMIATAASAGADPIVWALLILVTAAGAAGTAWLVWLRTQLSD